MFGNTRSIPASGSAAVHDAYSVSPEQPRSLRWIVAATLALFPSVFLSAVALHLLLSTLIPGSALEAFRVGNVALTNDTKTAEAAFPVAFFALLLLAVVLIYQRFRAIAPSVNIKSFVMLELILASPFLVQTLLGLGRPIVEIVDSPLLVTFALQLPPALFLATIWTLRTRRTATLAPLGQAFVPFLVLSSAVGFSSLGVITVARYLLAPTPLPAELAIMAWIVVSLALIGIIVWLAQSPQVTHRFAVTLGFTVSGLLTLPLLLPPLILQNDQAITSPGANSTMWKLAVAVLAVLVVSEAVFRWVRPSRFGIWSTVPSLAVAALLVPLRAAYLLPSTPADDYHFGELFAPFALLRDSGQLPYIDVYLPRGIFLNVLPGFVNAVVNDGSAAALAAGTTLIVMFTVSIAHLLLRSAIGFPLATAAVALMAVSDAYVEGDLLTVSIMVALLAWILRRPNPVLLGIVVICANAVSILAYPLMGLVSLGLTFAVLVAGLLGALISRSRRDLRYGLAVLVVSLATTGLVAFSPAGVFLRAAIFYVTANGASNTETFGVALIRTWMTSFGIGQVLSLSFVLGIAASLWLLWKRRAIFRSPSWNRYVFLGIAAVPAAFVIGLTGRYLGRIDPTAWSFRPAAGTLVVLGLVVPAVIWITGNKRARSLGLYSLAIAACVSIALLPLNQGGVVRSSLGMLEAPAAWASGPYTASAPRLGVGQGDATQMSAVSDLAAASKNFPAGETVLNLSNRGALFGYLGWHNPMPYLAAYNIESSTAEAAVIAQLDREMPFYALIGPGPQWDGVSLTLRNPELAKWMMQNYTPFMCGESVWATRGTGAAFSPGLLICPPAESAPNSNDASNSTAATPSVADLWTSSIGAPVDLDLIPVSWGSRSTDPAESEQLTVHKTVSSSDSAETLALATSGQASTTGELLILQVTCSTDAHAPEPSLRSVGDSRASLSWGTTAAPEAGLSRFEWGSGRFVVPLDSYPSWGLAPSQPDVLTLTAPIDTCSGGWDVTASLAPRP